MKTLLEENYVEDETISDITLNEDEFYREGYLYFHGEIIEKVKIKLKCNDTLHIYQYLYMSPLGFCQNLKRKVKRSDNSVLDIIEEMFFSHFYIRLFSSNEQISKTIFRNYIEDLLPSCSIKNGTLRINLEFGPWIRNKTVWCF